MAEQFDAKAVLSASIQGFKEAIDQLKEFKEAGDLSDILGPLQNYTRNLDRVADSLGGASKAARQQGKDIKYAAEGFEDYVKALGKADAAQKKFSQEGVTGRVSLDDLPASAAQGMSRQERDDYLAVEEARTATVISEIRKRNGAEDKAAAEKIRLIERESKIYNDYMEHQFAAEQKAADTKIREQKRAAAETERLLKEQDQLLEKAEATAARGIGAATAQQTRSSTVLNGDGGASAWDRAYSQALEGAEQRTRALEQAQAALYEKASPRLRYALYDVATTAGVTATAITGLGTAVGVASASFESSFTNVERTLENGLGNQEIADLREQLVGLTREMPLAFSEITEIATLGNQLGIAGDEVGQFTETVAKFSAVTGITVDAAATAFGSLGELLDVPTSQFENLGSAIAYVGRTSVATEAEIVAMSTRLAASASNAGFSAQQVIALSGAFASLRIAPERAQGVMEVYFKRLNDAISEGGDRLEAFGAYAGMAGSEVEAMVRSDPNQFFQRLATGLGRLDSIAQTRALDQLGLDGIRAGEVFGRVSSNVEVFNKALQDSDSSWAAGSELATQYGLVLDDLATRWQILLNAIAEAGAAAGDVIAPMLADLVGTVTELVQAFSAFASTDFGAWAIQASAMVGGLVAAIAGLVAIVAVAGGGLLAMRLAAVELGIVSATTSGGIGLLIARLLGLNGALNATTASGARASAALVGVGGAATKASGGMAAVGRGIGGVAKAAGALIIFDQIIRWIVDFDGQLKQVNGSLATSQRAWSDFANNGKFSIEMLYSPLGTLIGLISAAMQALSGLNITGDLAGNFSRAAAGGKASSRGTASIKQLKAANDALNFDDWALDASDYASALDDVGGAAGGAAEEIRTLVDYAGDLSSVMQRAFDIRFGSEQGMDAITSGWQSIAKAADEAREAAEEHRRTLADMGADRSIKQYWLSVAENYGDELRAAKLRAELAELDADMAKEKKGLVTAQDKASMALKGNSEAAVQNRSNILGLVGGYQEYLSSLAASGASQATLEAEATRLRAEFVRQATQMGFNRNEVERYARAFDDMILIINRIPRNITMDVNIDPAKQALAEFAAAARSAGSSAGSSLAGGIADGVNAAAIKMRVLQAAVDTARSVGDILRNWTPVSRGASKGGTFASGGYTGDMGVNQTAGVVHGQEFVMSAPAVRNIGVNNMARIHEAGKSGKGLGGVGLGGAPGMVDLSAGSIQALSRSLAANLQLVLPGAQLAGSVGAHNVVSARRGAA